MGLGRTLLVVATVVVIVVAVICHLIALITDYWLKSSSRTEKDFLNIGLWKACFHQYSHPHEDGKVYDGCHYLNSDYYSTIRDWLVPSWLVSCQALAIVALILQFVGVILVLFLLLWVICDWLCCRNTNFCCERFLIYATPIIFVLAGMFLMMAVMVFADNAFRLQCKDFWVGGEPNDNHLSHSWGFEVASCVFTFVSAGLIIWLAIITGRKQPEWAEL